MELLHKQHSGASAAFVSAHMFDSSFTESQSGQAKQESQKLTISSTQLPEVQVQ